MSQQEHLKQLEERIKTHESASSIFLASGPHVVNYAVKGAGFLQEAKENKELASDLLKICSSGSKIEMYVECVAFSVFKHVDYKEATPFLIAYVEKSADRPHIMAWNMDIATNTLIHLTGQEDPSPRYMNYTTEQRKEVIKKAKEYPINTPLVKS